QPSGFDPRRIRRPGRPMRADLLESLASVEPVPKQVMHGFCRVAPNTEALHVGIPNDFSEADLVHRPLCDLRDCHSICPGRSALKVRLECQRRGEDVGPDISRASLADSPDPLVISISKAI